LRALIPDGADMTNASTPLSETPRAARETIGRVVAVGGAQVVVGLTVSASASSTRATVGKFLGIVSGGIVTVGMITDISERPPRDQDPSCRNTAQIDIVGEIKASASGAAYFQRGITEYPTIGEPAVLMSDRELKLIFSGRSGRPSNVGVLQQDPTIATQLDIEQLVSKHFAVLGTTGTGKSSGVVLLLQQILEERADLRVFLIDPHNEYGRCFGDKAQVLTPRNLRLPFWLFNFEETVDAFFGGRPGVDEEVEILSEAIPLAKAAYAQLKGGSADRGLMKKKDTRDMGYGVDTPVPYRIEDLITVIDERMGKLENRARVTVYNKLLQRIKTFRNHPRYGFMFENATVGGDTMAEVVGHLFRLPANGKPMTIMQLAGFPAEVIDSVVSVLSRMAFDFGLWSDGASPLLFVCEEAHRYAPADKSIGFGPTKRALSRIAKEGRKYGVFLGLVTQRPAEIDPNIISQCSTLFVMRLSNDRDQALIRSAVSDAGASMLTFIPTLGTGEVFAFGAGVPLPTRMKFRELPAALRPTSEAASNTRVASSAAPGRDLIDSVIDRWRASTMSHKAGLDDDSDAGWNDDLPPRTRDDIPRGREETPSHRTAPPLQPAAPAAPAYAPTPAPIPAAARPASQPAPAPAAPAPAAEPRPSILRKPLTGAPGPNNPAPLPSRFRT
jgi:DNA helicase HerA-like ATPase